MRSTTGERVYLTLIVGLTVVAAPFVVLVGDLTGGALLLAVSGLFVALSRPGHVGGLMPLPGLISAGLFLSLQLVWPNRYSCQDGPPDAPALAWLVPLLLAAAATWAAVELRGHRPFASTVLTLVARALPAVSVVYVARGLPFGC